MEMEFSCRDSMRQASGIKKWHCSAGCKVFVELRASGTLSERIVQSVTPSDQISAFVASYGFGMKTSGAM